MSQKEEKVHNFLDPPLPLDDLDFFEFSKSPRKTRNISLKPLRLPKNHFKTNFFLQLKYLKCVFTFGGKNENMASPPPLLSKSPHFELWTF